MTLPAVSLWAGLGVVLLLLEAWLMVRWVTGPYFSRVHPGPDLPPDWMRYVLNIGQGVIVGLAGFALYWFVARPWRRNGRLSTEGLFCLACLPASFYDPLSSYTGNWFSYNTYLYNRGSMVAAIPGNQAVRTPDAMVAFPLILAPAIYVGVVILVALFARFVLRTIEARWPEMRKRGHLLLLFLAMCAFDSVLEGGVFMPLGFWSYWGGHFTLFSDHYFRFPLHVMATSSLLFTGLGALLHYRNDRGETIVEAGASSSGLTARQQTARRFLALTAVLQVVFVLTWHLPSMLIGANPDHWPADVRDRSYLNSGLCDSGMTACPEP